MDYSFVKPVYIVCSVSICMILKDRCEQYILINLYQLYLTWLCRHTHEDETTVLSRNVRNQLPSETVSYPRRMDTSHHCENRRSQILMKIWESWDVFKLERLEAEEFLVDGGGGDMMSCAALSPLLCLLGKHYFPGKNEFW